MIIVMSIDLDLNSCDICGQNSCGKQRPVFEQAVTKKMWHNCKPTRGPIVTLTVGMPSSHCCCTSNKSNNRISLIVAQLVTSAVPGDVSRRINSRACQSVLEVAGIRHLVAQWLNSLKKL